MINKQIKIIHLDYIDFFYYKLFIIKNIDFFKSYIDKTHVEEASLKFTIHYFIIQIKKNKLSINIFLCKI